MEYVSTDDSEKYDIKHGQLAETPLRGSAYRYVTNPIVDDIEADPDRKGRARRQRINGRIIIDTTVPDGDGGRHVSPSCLVTGEPSVNNLATHRWRNSGLPDAETEAELIRRVQGGDERAFRQLLEAFHRTNVASAGKHIPGAALYRRQPKNQKHTNDLLYEDLTSVGCFALWRAALKFDASGGHRFSTLSRHKIAGAISNEANYLRQRGYTSGDTVGRYLWKRVGRRTQGRLDRWIFDHFGSPPEELLEAQAKLVKRPVFHSLEEAAAALRAANDLEHSDVYSDDGEDGSGDVRETAATKPLDEFRALYDSYNPEPRADVDLRIGPILAFGETRYCEPSPKPKRVSRPQPTGRVLHPTDKPYWVESRDKHPTYRVSKPYDPDRRELAVIRLKNGKAKRVYRQVAAGPCRQIYVKSANQRGKNVRPNRNETSSRPSAEIIVLQGRASSVERLHVSERHYSSRVG
jgi:hypothetical protein